MIKYFLIGFLFFMLSCVKNKNGLNQFTSSSDTLIIKTKKKSGDALFSIGAYPLIFKDTLEFSTNMSYPEYVINVKRAQRPIYFLPENDNFIEIMKGENEKEWIFVVDENNNKDFSDDSVRIQKKMNWFSSDDLIKIRFETVSEGLKTKDSSWVKIGIVENRLFFGRSEHLIADFSLDDQRYEIGMVDIRAGDFTYGSDSELALLSENSVKKDSLLKKDILKIGEFVQLGVSYYRFEKISANGKHLTLIREKNFEKIIGTQIGMIAPRFNGISTQGEPVNSNSLHDKIIVVANTCACGGDKESSKAFYEIQEKFDGTINLIGLDSKINSKRKGLLLDMEHESNREVYKNLRQMYCSRICLVIGTDNRIIDKFEIANWKKHLDKYSN